VKAEDPADLDLIDLVFNLEGRIYLLKFKVVVLSGFGRPFARAKK